MKFRLLAIILTVVVASTACSPGETPTKQVFQATLPQVAQNAPVYTATLTLTPSDTPTATPTLTLTPSLTPSSTLTPTPTLTFTPSNTPTPIPTQPLFTLTPASAEGAPPNGGSTAAGFSEPVGWSCEEFPCEDDIEGFLQRIQVPSGYAVEHVGQFPGQPLQITYGGDGRLYATVLENGTLDGAVYVMNADGSSERYSETLRQPIGLAFQPGTDVLYISGRITPTSGGALWRISSNGTSVMTETVFDDLPCCFGEIGSQPNGLTFGPDGYLYLGLGALTDHLEPPNPQRMRYAELDPLEASILRIQPHTGDVEVYAQGLHNSYDLAFAPDGTAYVSDNGLLEGFGDRLLAVQQGQHFGWPYWRSRGCFDCPFTDASLTIQPDLITFPSYTLPRGVAVYSGTQFPADLFGSVFVALWNGTPEGQRIVRIDPRTVPTDPEALAAYKPDPFVTGLIRPTDVIAAPDGALVIADFVYGHVWRVSYTGQTTTPRLFITSTPRP